jgi:molecular chaperone DnaJ
VHFRTSLTLEEAFRGVETSLEFPTLLTCKTCQGSGSKSSSGSSTCQKCHGHGVVHLQRGFLAVQQECPQCHGQGTVIKDPCGECRGQGRSRSRRTLTVKIPAGIDQGSQVRVSGKGEDGAYGGPAGDLYVEITLKTHELFQRDGQTLSCSYPISMVQAALGSTVDIPTIDGTVEPVTIPAGIQPGEKIVLKGKGMPSIRSSHRGAMYVYIQPYTPVHLNDKQKEYLQMFQQETDAHPTLNSTDGAKGFLKKITDILKKFSRGT